MPLSDVRVLRQFQTQRFTEGGQVQSVIRTEFKVGDDGPFSVDLPTGEFSAATQRAAMEKVADQVRATRHHSEPSA